MRKESANSPAYADEEFPYNVMEINDPSIGFIASGVTYLHTKEVFPQYSFLKLGMTWPLPKKLIAEFFKKVKKVIVVEELDPFFETEIRAMGFKVRHGKDLIPAIGELTPTIIEQSLSKAVTGKRIKPAKPAASLEELPKRPPNLCAGCSHRPLFCCVEKARPFRLRRYRLLCAGGLSASVRHAFLDLHGRRSRRRLWRRQSARQRGTRKDLRRAGRLDFSAQRHRSLDGHGLQRRLFDNDYPGQPDYRHDRTAGTPGNRIYDKGRSCGYASITRNWRKPWASKMFA